MPLAILAASLIAAAIALMVFDGARKAKLLEVREGWARGLRNDLALVIARSQSMQPADTTNAEENAAAFDEMLVRLYRAHLRLREGKGHARGFSEIATTLTKKLERVRQLLRVIPSNPNPDGSNKPDAEKLKMTLENWSALRSATDSGERASPPAPEESRKYWLGDLSKSPPLKITIDDDLCTIATAAMTDVWKDIMKEANPHTGLHFFVGCLLLAVGLIVAGAVVLKSL